MGRWSITSVLTIIQIFFLFSFWIEYYSIMTNQRILFIEIKIKKKKKKWKVEKDEKKSKEKREG